MLVHAPESVTVPIYGAVLDSLGPDILDYLLAGVADPASPVVPTSPPRSIFDLPVARWAWEGDVTDTHA